MERKGVASFSRKLGLRGKGEVLLGVPFSANLTTVTFLPPNALEFVQLAVNWCLELSSLFSTGAQCLIQLFLLKINK